MSFRTQSEFLLEVEKGNIPGHSILRAFGERENVGTTSTGEDIWRGTATSVPTPDSAGEQMEIVSSDPNDIAGGTGVRSVLVTYLDASGNEQTTVVPTSGTAPVALTSSDVRFVQSMSTFEVGSNGVAEGDITIYKQGAATTIYSLIENGGNMALLPHRMVPSGKTLYIQGWHASVAQDKRNAVRLRSTDLDGVLYEGVFLFKDTTYLEKGSSGGLPVHVKVPAFSIVKVSSWASALGGEVACGWWGVLVDD